jgi:hypothetical protein
VLAGSVRIAAGLLALAVLTGAGLQAWRHGWPVPIASVLAGAAPSAPAPGPPVRPDAVSQEPTESSTGTAPDDRP